MQEDANKFLREIDTEQITQVQNSVQTEEQQQRGVGVAPPSIRPPVMALNDLSIRANQKMLYFNPFQ